MAANLNKVFLMGNLTRDPELKYTPQGAAVARFSVAVNRQYKGGDGEMKKDVNFFNIVVWNKQGENCSKFLKKGSGVLVEGRLQNRTFETQDKQKRTVTEIVAENVQFLSASGGQRGTGSSEEGADYGQGDFGDEGGFAPASPASGGGSSEDVPF